MRDAAGVFLGIVLALVAAGCGSTLPTATAPVSTVDAAALSGTASPPVALPSADASTRPAVPQSAAPGTAASATPSNGPGMSGTPGATEDASLIALLPASVEGVPVNLEHQAFLDAVADPAFAQHVRRAAFGVAVDGQDLASGVVAELAPDTFSDAFFRDWRDTYDAGACRQSGGVVGNAETRIEARTVYIATCAGGLRTYHAWLPERGTIVSAFSVGDRRLGEALMEGLRP